MPTQDNTAPSSSPSPFEITNSGKSKKASSKGVIIALVVVLFLGLGIFAGVMLVRQQQDIREEAATSDCPAAQACPVPGQPTLLRNCTPQESDGSASESLCNSKGRIEACGGVDYCCPGPNQAWTTNMALCATATAVATATATASPTATATATSTSTSTGTAAATATPTKTGSAVPTATATKAPIPETGTGWPTYLGAGVGIMVIIGALLLAL